MRVSLASLPLWLKPAFLEPEPRSLPSPIRVRGKSLQSLWEVPWRYGLRAAQASHIYHPHRC